MSDRILSSIDSADLAQRYIRAVAEAGRATDAADTLKGELWRRAPHGRQAAIGTPIGVVIINRTTSSGGVEIIKNL